MAIKRREATSPSEGLANGTKPSQNLLRSARANELFVAVVAPAGAGAGTAANLIKGYLEQELIDELPYEVHVVKASTVIREWAQAKGRPVPPSGVRKSLEGIEQMQDNGDAMRLAVGDNAAVARAVIRQISQVRAQSSGLAVGDFDSKPRAYVIDSLRHPAEAHLLRRLYQDAFTLVGVVCDPSAREARLRENLFEMKDRNTPKTSKDISDFIDRDANAPQRYGQHVIDTFHEADFFVDNSQASRDVNDTGMNEPLRRLVGLLTSRGVVRPTVEETAMHHAHSSQLRSACMSRQVGAALVDEGGNVIARADSA